MTAGPRHGRRILLLWLPASVIADLLIWFVLGPHLPPGDMASAATNQQVDIKVMAVMAAPVMLAVLIYFGYALAVWRQPAGDETDGPPLHGNTRVQVSWVAATSLIVLVLFIFGTVELVGAHGAGAGEGPSPIWKPGGSPLQVQVIGQQWKFTYRYPQFGGFETSQLVLPEGQWVQFNVTSLDVIHSFWAYQLGVKADANPGVNNVAFTKPLHLGQVTVRCAELCGLWHGAMFDYGKVMPVAAFQAWASATRAHLATITAMLPPYATTYDPTVIPNINKAMAKAGITGANGYYYPPQDPTQP
ncbi:MAG TPA: cytochrome c oxidase subunit II [Streptosporangiaceae bacterium]|nr:cytochrome c oxidase subunit II [Streptosporangiaceae bacterium]